MKITTDKIKHAYIAPINYLHYIPRDSDFHLLLAHLLKDEDYCNFYRERKKKGDYLIIDNGAFEFKRPLEAHELYDLILNANLQPDVIVAPDYPFQEWDITVKSTEDFAKAYHKYFDNSVKLMAVPQSVKGDYKGWVEGYHALSQIDDVELIGMSILGIPHAFCSVTGTEDIALNRIYATVYLKQRQLVEQKFHHYLGLGSNVRELLIQKELRVMTSNDSSSAIWHGIQGIIYDDSAGGLMHGKSPKPVDFHIDHIDDPKIKECILHNIAYIEQLCLRETKKFETPPKPISLDEP